MVSPVSRPMSEDDLTHLRHCVDLAHEALDAGDAPFGSMLVGPDGQVLFEDRNRVNSGDATHHPELAVARWAAEHVPAEQRARCVVYTSGEHCPMCSAAHALAGLGRIVYAASSDQLGTWFEQWGVDAGPVRPLPIRQVAPGIEVAGPATELSDRIGSLHARYHGVS